MCRLGILGFDSRARGFESKAVEVGDESMGFKVICGNRVC